MATSSAQPPKHGDPGTAPSAIAVPINADQAVALMASLVAQPANCGRYRGLDMATPIEGISAATLDGTALLLGIAGTGAMWGSPPPVQIGLIQIFALNLIHGTAQAGVIVDERLHRSGWPLEAVIDAIRLTFRRYPLRRLYFELPTYNESSIAGSLTRLVDGPAVLPSHEYFDGAFWDVAIFWVGREAFAQLDRTTLSRGHHEWLTASSLEAFDASLQQNFSIGSPPKAETVPLIERGLDSLAMLELIVAVESLLDRHIPDKAIHARLTSADLYHWVSDARG